MHKLTLNQLPETLQFVQTRPLMVLTLDVSGPVDIGMTPGHNRKIGQISGGVFEGDRLRGTVLDGGADWQTVRQDGAWTMDVRVVLRTDDDALIAMTYQGIRAGEAEVLKRLPQGGVEPSEYYFRTTPVFETASEKYGWLNSIITVGIGHRLPQGPVYSIFEVL
ncbi:TPA: DUF3237 domain-containing protein [Serratia fonticola]|nr:DUF3237 domain-containing protein [Serratia fonticola]